MAQVWVTYEELGRHLDCGPLSARDHVARSGWPRRKCSDGATRVKLPVAVMDDYIQSTWMPNSASLAVMPTLHVAWLGKQHAG